MCSLIAMLGFKTLKLTSAGPWAVLVLTTLIKRIWHKIDMYEIDSVANKSAQLSKIVNHQTEFL